MAAVFGTVQEVITSLVCHSVGRERAVTAKEIMRKVEGNIVKEVSRNQGSLAM